MDMFTTPEFWVAVGQIILIDILLGGDNAVVIALACRSLPPQQRLKGILWGTVGAIALRVLLIFFALTLLKLPLLKLAGAGLLIWIGVKLLLPEDEGAGHGQVAASDKLWGAVKTVIVADLVMSVDNVIAIAGAAQSAGSEHTMPLVIFGLLVSIPIIVWGSQLVLKLMDRFPMVITLGGLLLGWIAGTMAVTDPAIAGWMPQDGGSPPEVQAQVRYGAGIAGAALVLLLGQWFARPRAAQPPLGPMPARPLRPILRVLLAVDGSQGAAAAAQRVRALRDGLPSDRSLELHVVNVQRPLTEDVARFIAGRTIEEYHRERSDAIMGTTRESLGDLAPAMREHHLVGTPAQAITDLARDLDCDMIVMGARGLSAPTAALVGSVTQSTLERATVPVEVVR